MAAINFFPVVSNSFLNFKSHECVYKSGSFLFCGCGSTASAALLTSFFFATAGAPAFGTFGAPSVPVMTIGNAPTGAAFGAPAAPLMAFGKVPAAAVFGAPVAARTLSHYNS